MFTIEKDYTATSVKFTLVSFDEELKGDEITRINVETVDTFTVDTTALPSEEIDGIAKGFGLRRKIENFYAGAKGKGLNTSQKYEAAKNGWLEMEKTGKWNVGSKAGKINKEVVGIAKGLKMAGLDKEKALAAFANQPNISQADIDFSIDSVYSD